MKAKAKTLTQEDERELVQVMWIVAALVVASLAFLLLTLVHADAQTLPSAKDLSKAAADTGAAIDAGKIAVDEWKAIFIAAWAVLYPLLVQLPAVVKNLQSTPGVGLLVKYLAGNWGFAANANRDPR